MGTGGDARLAIRPFHTIDCKTRAHIVADSLLVFGHTGKCGEEELGSSCFAGERCQIGLRATDIRSLESAEYFYVASAEAYPFAGCVAADSAPDGSVFIHSLCVHHALRRRGVGDALLRCFDKFPLVRLNVRKSHGNGPAARHTARQAERLLAFYAKKGFLVSSQNDAFLVLERGR